MHRILIFILLTIFFMLIGSTAVFADGDKDFDIYMNLWNTKRELASEFLLKAENAFKQGDELSGCSLQEQASSYGIEATNALITAMKMQNSSEGIENLEAGLRKWQELGDFC